MRTQALVGRCAAKSVFCRTMRPAIRNVQRLLTHSFAGPGKFLICAIFLPLSCLAQGEVSFHAQGILRSRGFYPPVTDMAPLSFTDFRDTNIFDLDVSGRCFYL